MADQKKTRTYDVHIGAPVNVTLRVVAPSASSAARIARVRALTEYAQRDVRVLSVREVV